MVTRKYYYSKLSQQLRSTLDSIIGKLQRQESVITIVNPTVTAEQLGMLFEVIDKDFPEIFFIDIKKAPIEIAVQGPIKRISVNYVYNSSDVRYLRKEIDGVISKIVTPEMLSQSILDREKIIHDYLANNVVYHYGSSDTDDYSIVGPIFRGKAICEGYSKAFKYIGEKSNLNCMVVSGKALNARFSKTENHAWNIIYIGKGEYAHVDVTWDSGKANGVNILYSYYNLSDEAIGNDHYWDHTLTPICNVCIDNGIVLLESAKDLADYIIAQFAKGISTFDFKVNKDFQSTDELVDLIRTIILKKHLFNVKSFKVMYNRNNRSVHCEFDII